MLIIPAIDLIRGRCVRLYQGDYSQQTTYDNDPAQQALIFEKAGFGRLHVVDLEGARDGAGGNRAVVESIRKSVNMPLQLGGGIRSTRDVRVFIDRGIDYLILGTILLENPEKVSQWVRLYNPSVFIAGLDLRDGKLLSRGWRKESPVGLQDALERLSDWGIQQIVCTDIKSDGTLREPNFSSYEKLRDLLPPGTQLIAAGGISRPGHIQRLRRIGLAGAVVGKALYEGSFTLEEWADAG